MAKPCSTAVHGWLHLLKSNATKQSPPSLCGETQKQLDDTKTNRITLRKADTSLVQLLADTSKDGQRTATKQLPTSEEKSYEWYRKNVKKYWSHKRKSGGHHVHLKQPQTENRYLPTHGIQVSTELCKKETERAPKG